MIMSVERLKAPLHSINDLAHELRTIRVYHKAGMISNIEYKAMFESIKEKLAQNPDPYEQFRGLCFMEQRLENQAFKLVIYKAQLQAGEITKEKMEEFQQAADHAVLHIFHNYLKIMFPDFKS